jgi:hypothetical protein
MNTLDEIVKEIDHRVHSAEVGDMEDLGYFVRENWATLRSHRNALRESLFWALDLLDLYDERLATIDGWARVYTETHIEGKRLARARLAGSRGITLSPSDNIWKCKARAGAFDPPVDCDWPTCGCDPLAEKVIDALRESGWTNPDDRFQGCEACGAMTDFDLMRSDAEGCYFCPQCFADMKAEDTPTQVEPHDFEPLRFWDRWHDDGRCRQCRRPKWVHPTGFWAEARPMMDFSKARLPGSEDVVR